VPQAPKDQASDEEMEEVNLLDAIDEDADEPKAKPSATATLPKSKVPPQIRKMFLDKHAELMDEHVVPIM
jgi:hypothetical protein